MRKESRKLSFFSIPLGIISGGIVGYLLIPGVWQDRQRMSAIRKAAVSTFLYFFMVIAIPFLIFHSESGFAMNAPTMLVNSRRHQAFMSRRNTCPPNIRHQDLKMLEVDWDAPMENATGAV